MQPRGNTGLLPTLPDHATTPDTAGDASGPRSQRRLAAGAPVGRYQITSVLGAGGMGVVYAAEDRELGRALAIKILRPELRDGAGQGRLLREAQAMARVSHPNVVAVHDVGVHEGDVFVAMELAPGTTLRDWLRRTPRTISEVLAVFAAVGRGLAAAHAAGITHRDVKPDNVLVGDDGRVRVTDFGLARAAGGDGGAMPGDAPIETADTRAGDSGGQLAGTPAYMSPEQLLGEHVDARSDQFGFAIALYEALYGERPFAGATIAELRDAVGQGAVRPPPARAKVSGTLRAVVLRALAVRPGDRYPTMDALLAALGRDRTRGARAAAIVGGALALAAATALIADGVARGRARDDAHASFAAAGAQLDRSLGLRMEAFDILAGVSSAAPDMREVTGLRDEAEFGLGTPEGDAVRFAKVHEAMASADWLAFARGDRHGVVAIADAKGRVVYSTGAPDQYGGDVLALLPGALGRDSTARVVRGDDLALLDSGLTGGAPGDQLQLVLAHTIAPDHEPRALFLQLVEARAILADVALGAGTDLAVVAPDGSLAGDAPPDVVRAAQATTRRELDVGGTTWLVERRPLPGPDGAPIAQLVMTRRLDVGLAGLFPFARVTLASLTALLLALSALAWWSARSRQRTLAGVTPSARARRRSA